MPPHRQRGQHSNNNTQFVMVVHRAMPLQMNNRLIFARAKLSLLFRIASSSETHMAERGVRCVLRRCVPAAIGIDLE